MMYFPRQGVRIVDKRAGCRLQMQHTWRAVGRSIYLCLYLVMWIGQERFSVIIHSREKTR